MMQQMNGPQRGRRSQHHSHANKPPGQGSSRSGRGNNTETALDHGGEYPSSVPSSPHPNKNSGGANSDPHAMESGFFNKYAVADDQVDARNKGDAPDLPKTVQDYYICNLNIIKSLLSVG